MVCDRATAKVTEAFSRTLDALRLQGQTLPKDMTMHRGSTMKKGGGLEHSCLLITHGKSAHASHPERGDNALYKMLNFFAPHHAELAKIKTLFVDDGMELTKLQDESGQLTYAANIAEFEDSTLKIGIDIRYPATMQQADITKIFDRHNLQYALVHCQPPIFHDPESALIQTLYSVYTERTGRTDKPMAIGGGTYARALEFGVAFGPQFADEEDSIHQPDEYIYLKNIPLYFDIYKEAIYRLTK